MDCAAGLPIRSLLKNTSIFIGAIAVAGGITAVSALWSAEATELRGLLPFVLGAALANGVAAICVTKFVGRANRLVVRTIPFFQLSVIFGAIEVCFQYARGIGGEEISMGDAARRVANGGMAAWWYLGKVVAPVRLNSVYPGWSFDAPAIVKLVPAALFVACLLLVWHYREAWAGALFFALTYFVIGLLPVLGFFKMGLVWQNTFVTDHFQYFSDISVIALVCAGATVLWCRAPSAGRIALGSVAVLSMSAMALYSWDRASIYKNEETLWLDVLSKNPDAWQGHQRIGETLFRDGKFREATEHLKRAAELKPNNPDIHNMLGLSFCREERFEEGIAEYQKAIESTLNRKRHARGPLATIHTNFANALGMIANRTGASEGYERAVNEYGEALKLDPDNAATHRNLALVLAQIGAYDNAIAHLERTLQLMPGEPVATEMLAAIRQQRATK